MREKRRYALTDHTHEIDVCLAGDGNLPPRRLMACTMEPGGEVGESVAVEVLRRERPRIAAAEARRAPVPPSVRSPTSRAPRTRSTTKTLRRAVQNEQDQIVIRRFGVGEGTSDGGWHKGGSPAHGGAYVDPERARRASIRPIGPHGAVAAAGVRRSTVSSPRRRRRVPATRGARRSEVFKLRDVGLSGTGATGTRTGRRIFHPAWASARCSSRQRG